MKVYMVQWDNHEKYVLRRWKNDVSAIKFAVDCIPKTLDGEYEEPYEVYRLDDMDPTMTNEEIEDLILKPTFKTPVLIDKALKVWKQVN